MAAATPKTVVFKTFRNADGSETEIPADVYLPTTEAAGTSDAPLLPVFWVHTGGLLQGTRKFVAPHLIRGAEKHRVALIAPDFRLCPQVTIDEVLEDVRDCLRFFLDRSTIAAQLGPDRIDTTRYVLGGSSAGGWISLLLGLDLVEQAHSLPLRPSAVFSIYPITTLDRQMADFFYQPQRPLSWSQDGKLIDALVLEQQGCLLRCVDGSEGKVQPNDRGVLIKTASPPLADPVRAQLYNFARQEGQFASLVLSRPEDAAKVSTPHLIRRRLAGDATGKDEDKVKVPVLISYGDSDPKVPHSQSLNVIEALDSVGYSTEKGTLHVHVKQGGDHLFDMEEGEEIEGLWPLIDQARH